MKKLLLFFALLMMPWPIQAEREEITDWYVRNFSTVIELNKDSSLTITETITADCGNLPDKHGIFRVLPTVIHTTDGDIKTPIALLSITNETGQAYEYSVIGDSFNDTITWKIGDADKTVSGLNVYVIKYKVANAVRGENVDFDELYWNLSGNFWEFDIDKFTAKIILPEAINQENSEVYLYSGDLNEADNKLANYYWETPNTMIVESKQTLLPGQGISASVAFPKNIVDLYVPSWWEKNGEKLFWLIPLAALGFGWSVWRRYGADPKLSKTIIPEFAIPGKGKFGPMELAALSRNGGFRNSDVSAGIVDLAVGGLMTIEQIGAKGFFKKEDYQFKKTAKAPVGLSAGQQELYARLFNNKQEVLLSSLKNKFYKDVETIKKTVKNELLENNLLDKAGFTYQIIMGILAAACFAIMIVLSGLGSAILSFNLVTASVILILFTIVMPKKTLAGAELAWQIKGFQLYMKTAEKYRQQFNEKENIFEKFLPYAMVFGLTGLWIAKMKELYGEQYFASYHPVWFVGGNLTSFDTDSFTSAMNGISASIASNMSAPSGAGGGGSAGGGGGGGGGGGW